MPYLQISGIRCMVPCRCTVPKSKPLQKLL